MTLANKITIFRFILVPIFIIFMLCDFTGHSLISLIVFILASVTDLVDGYIARHYNQVTDFGKFADPLADKVLILSACAIFIELGQMPSWCFIIILVRELAVTGLRLIAVEKNLVIAAGMAGKVKTFSSAVACCIMLTPLKDIMLFGIEALTFNNICVFVMVATTLYSGFEYFIKNAFVFKGSL